MLSYLLVALQFALLAAVVLPLADHAWPPYAIALALVGAALGAWAVAVNRPGNFNIRPDPKAGGRLVTAGPYRFVRHPMYVALLVLAFGCVLGDPTAWRWAAFAALAVVLHLKAAREEAGMARHHAGYADYARRTARSVPFLRRPPPSG